MRRPLRRRIRPFPAGDMRPDRLRRGVYCHGKWVEVMPSRNRRALCSGCGEWLPWYVT